MTTIKQGDIVRSNGRIATKQDGRQRFIEFEGALVLEAEGSDITVSPVGKTAVLICQQGDLHLARSAPSPAPASEPPKPKPKATPSLRRIKQTTDKPTTTKKPSAKKSTASRRRPS